MSASVRVKGGESEQFRIDNGVRQGCIMSPWLMKEVKDEDGEDGNEISGGGETAEIT